MAVSGAIFNTLMPLPLHSELGPPSTIICLKPPTRLMRLLLDEWTWSINVDLQINGWNDSQWRGQKQCLTCIKTFILSRGAVPVRLTAPAAAPATRCFHQRPELFSSSVNSSGMARLSPMSSTWRQQESSFLSLTGQCCQAHRSSAEALPLPRGLL